MGKMGRGTYAGFGESPRTGRPGTIAWRRTASLVMAVALVIASPALLGAQEPADPAEADAWPSADPADVGSIDAIIGALYEVISGEAGEERDWDRFRSLFIPEARLIPSGRRPDGSHGYRVMTPQQYIDGPGGWLVQNGFFEDEAHSVVERWSGIAHVFSTYNSYRTAADMRAGDHFQRGINSFQLMFDGERWWVVSIMWEGESPDRPIAEEYLPGEAG